MPVITAGLSPWKGAGSMRLDRGKKSTILQEEDRCYNEWRTAISTQIFSAGAGEREVEKSQNTACLVSETPRESSTLDLQAWLIFIFTFSFSCSSNKLDTSHLLAIRGKEGRTSAVARTGQVASCVHYWDGITATAAPCMPQAAGRGQHGSHRVSVALAARTHRSKLFYMRTS